MSAVETRHISRDSLFLLAELRLSDAAEGQRVKVRNLSAGGMMAEGDFKLQRGDAVVVGLKNIGDVRGSIAWVQDNRCGVAFADTIDPKLARAPVGDPQAVTNIYTPRVKTTPVDPDAPARLRKI